MAPLMIIGSVPLYNIMAVVVLSLFQPDQNGFNQQLIKKTVKGIVTNPIIIGIFLGIIWSFFRLPMPKILEKTIHNVGNVASPMGHEGVLSSSVVMLTTLFSAFTLTMWLYLLRSLGLV